MSVTPGPEHTPKINNEPMKFTIQVASENSLIIYFGINNPNQKPIVTPALCTMIGKAQSEINASLGNVILDTVPSYNTLMITYDFWQLDHFHIRAQIQTLLDKLVANHKDEYESSGRTIVLPVYYDPSVGPDLARIAKSAGISNEEVIQLHLQQEYYVYTIGFAPGFAYLGEVHDTIAMPRLATPRASVAKGSVAIADKQTAIYPATSPGGWNIIGRCPTPMFDANHQSPIPVAVGDKIRFKAITRNQFLALGGQL